MSEAPDGRDPVELAHWLFDRARPGEVQRLGAYVEAGAPVDLTDASGNSLLMLAAYHGHADAVRVLVAAGADPDLGSPSARAAAEFFARPDLATLLPPAS